MQYTIEFYEKENGKSDVWNFLEALRIKSSISKDARIQYKQLLLYIQLFTGQWDKTSRYRCQTYHRRYLGITPRK